MMSDHHFDYPTNLHLLASVSRKRAYSAGSSDDSAADVPLDLSTKKKSRMEEPFDLTCRSSQSSSQSSTSSSGYGSMSSQSSQVLASPTMIVDNPFLQMCNLFFSQTSAMSLLPSPGSGGTFMWDTNEQSIFPANYEQDEEASDDSEDSDSADGDDGDDEEDSGDDDADNVINDEISIEALKCDICGEILRCKQTLRRHRLYRHGKFKHQCMARVCGFKDFETSDQLDLHLRSVHSQVVHWNCAYCPTKEFNTHSILVNHFFLNHQMGTFTCRDPGCTFVANYAITVQRHALKRHPPKFFICALDNCGKKFKQRGNLTLHQRFHLAIKPYECRWVGCRYASEVRSNTLRHIRTVHLRMAPTAKAQKAKGDVEDARNPNNYLHINTTLL